MTLSKDTLIQVLPEELILELTGQLVACARIVLGTVVNLLRRSRD